MGGILFGKSQRSYTFTPLATGLRVQNSIQGRPRAIGAGMSRISGSLIWWGDFSASKASSPGGKGGAIGSIFGKGQGFDYTTSVVISICEGPVVSINSVYNGNAVDFLVEPSAEVLADLRLLGIIPTFGDSNIGNAVFFPGDFAQEPWSFLTATAPTQALAYRGEALACFANFALGSTPTFPNFSWEVLFGLNTSAGSPTPDVNPVDWFTAFLTNADWGVPGFPAALIGDMSVLATYCRAYGLFISPALTDQSAAQSHLGDIMTAIAADFKWSQGALSAGVYADLPATGNGVTFFPAMTPVYALGHGDFLPNQGTLGSVGSEVTPITISRKNPSQAINMVQVEYLDRSNLYNPVTVYASDDATIVSTGRTILGDLQSDHFFCTATAAVASAPLQLARERVLATFQFTLGSQYALLEIFDIVSLDEPRLGLNGKLVRIIEIQENDDQSLTMTAEEVLGTIGPTEYATQRSLGAATNNLANPGAVNPPIIFEPPANLAVDQVWIAVSGVQTAFWGGANFWVSVDGVTFEMVGSVTVPSRQGALTAALPSVTPSVSGLTIDSTNTLSVDLTESAGALISGSAADLNALVTLCYVDGELIAYENATLTTGFAYNLSPLVRGAYGSTIGDHPIGALFARLDDNIFKFSYDAGQIGSTISIKIQGVNIFGGGSQDLSGLTAFTYTIIGSTPARVDHYNSVSIPTSGMTITFERDGTSTPAAFTSGPLGSALPFVDVTWTITTGDTLVVTALSLSSVNIQITNAGVGVARTVNVVVEGH